MRQVVVPAHICSDNAVGVEGGVETAIHVVAHKREVIVAADPPPAGDDDLSIGLLDHSPRHRFGGPSQVREDFAVAVKGRIQSAVGMKARDGDAASCAGRPMACDDNLSIRLND
jgi:hypothetical protein